MLSSPVRLGLPRDIFLVGSFSVLYAPVLIPICATCPSYLILILMNLIIFYEHRKAPPYVVFSIPPVTFVLFRPKYLSQCPILEYFSACSLLRVGGQLSHPYKTAGKFILLYILEKQSERL